MSDNFNGLTNEQTELLSIMSEECGEVVQAVGKIMRHGLDSHNPNTGETNTEQLIDELGDVMLFIGILCDKGIIDKVKLQKRIANKLAKLTENENNLLHHLEI